jgi:acyl dehydratase
MTVPDPEEIRAMRIPDGTYELTEDRHAALLRHVHAPDLFTTKDGGEAHPIFAHIATNRGMGWDFPVLLEHLGSSPADGVVFGGGTFRFTRLLTIGERYTIRARMHDVARKQGRRIGTFDAVTLALDVVAPDGSTPVRTTETYVVPRRSDATPVTASPPPAAPPPPGRSHYAVGPISREDIAGIMAMMEDTNPVHVDTGLARAAGYRGAVHQGPANLAFVFDAIALDRGTVADVRHAAFTFRDTVTEGDRLAVHLDGTDPITGRLDILGIGTALDCEIGFS